MPALISCLTVTQPSRYQHFQRALDCFSRQTWPDKQLVVVIDGDEDYRQRIEALCAPRSIDAKVLLGTGKTLGDKRNETVAAADGELLCCWDDDDQYHPARLSIAAKHLDASGADYCYLSGCLHYFADTGDLSWLDCCRMADGIIRPNLPNCRAICGSLLAKANRMQPYPSRDHGEDSAFLLHAMVRKIPIHMIDGYGWSYLRCFHGDNTTSRTSQARDNQFFGCRLNQSELDRAVRKMREEFDPHFSLASLLSEYTFEHPLIEICPSPKERIHAS